jgi:hypothetical protein
MELNEILEEAISLQGEVKKLCRKCNQEKPLKEFYTRRDRRQGDRYGKVSKCKDCGIKDYQRWYQNLSPERLAKVRQKGRKASYLSRHRGRLSEAEAEQLSESKLGNCEICHKASEVFIDHCHETDKRRGFLCQNCNFMIGLAKDNVNVLIASVDYLVRYMQKNMPRS